MKNMKLLTLLSFLVFAVACGNNNPNNNSNLNNNNNPNNNSNLNNNNNQNNNNNNPNNNSNLNNNNNPNNNNNNPNNNDNLNSNKYYLYTTVASQPYVDEVFGKDKKFEKLPFKNIKSNDISFIFVRADNDRFGTPEIHKIITAAKPSQNILFIRIISDSSTVHGVTNMTTFIENAKKVAGYENANIDFVFITRSFAGKLDQAEVKNAQEKINNMYKK